MAKATGVATKIVYKKEVTEGVLNGPSGGRYIRRTGFTLNQTAENFTSNEINTSYQRKDTRLGIKSAEGSLAAELSPGEYSDFFGSLLAKDFVAETGTASASITVAAVSGKFYTVTRDTGSFLTDGIKVGQVVRMSGGTLHADNTDNNCLVTGVTALELTVKYLSSTPLVAEGPIASVAVVQAGKSTWIPQTGHTDDSYNFERFHSDISVDEVYTGVKIGSTTINIPTSGYTTADFSLMGRGIGSTGTTAYFTAPSAASSNGLLTAVQGSFIFDGGETACVTDASITVERNMEAANCQGSDYNSGIFVGRITVNGSFTAYLSDGTLRGKFVNELTATLVLAVTTGNTKTADFITYTLPKIKITSIDESDGDMGITLTVNFDANENSDTSAGLVNSTIMIQDSAAA